MAAVSTGSPIEMKALARQARGQYARIVELVPRPGEQSAAAASRDRYFVCSPAHTRVCFALCRTGIRSAFCDLL